MNDSLKNIFTVTDLRNRVLFTLGMLAVYRLGHNITIQQGSSGSVLGATPTFQGGSKTLSVSLKPGTYTFYCTVPGHRAAGMEGKLTVQ